VNIAYKLLEVRTFLTHDGFVSILPPACRAYPPANAWHWRAGASERKS
jgi:hypothetical protein